MGSLRGSSPFVPRQVINGEPQTRHSAVEPTFEHIEPTILAPSILALLYWKPRLTLVPKKRVKYEERGRKAVEVSH
jgi:hypothetical protein